MTAHGLRRLALLTGFAACLVGGLQAGPAWVRGFLLALGALAGVALSIEGLTRSLSALVEGQRWKYKCSSETGKTIVVPNPSIRRSGFKRLFGHPDVDQKTSGGLRRLIRWWHAPCSDCHQEIMERGELYLEVRAVTGRILSMPVDEVRRLAREHLGEGLARQRSQDADWSVTRLRTIVGPMALSFCYEFVLGRKCPVQVLPVLLASTADVIAATRGTSRRDMPLRLKALAHLESVLVDGRGRQDIFGDACPLSIDQKAKYLQGVWMHTGAAQIMRLTCNALCHLARNRRCLDLLRQDDTASANSYADAVLLETLRLTPGITSTNRVASKDVALDGGGKIERGTNIIFDFEALHRTDFDEPAAFIPERWRADSKKDVDFMPFGVGKRRCPAERLAMAVAKELVLGLSRALDIHVPAGSGLLFASRSTISNDLCCLVRRPSIGALRLWGIRCWLGGVLMIDSVRKSLIQLAVMPRNAKEAFHEID